MIRIAGGAGALGAFDPVREGAPTEDSRVQVVHLGLLVRHHRCPEVIRMTTGKKSVRLDQHSRSEKE